MTEYPFDLGLYSRRVTTASETCQLWFDRGFNWLFGFNHEEAAVCFKNAIAADPHCAMAHWGVAYAIGPNYNKTWKHFDEAEMPKMLSQARAALVLARKTAAHASGVEQALVAALAERFQADTAAADMAPWSDAYALAMRRVSQQFLEDLDVIALCVDAMMNRTPWLMWDLCEWVPNTDCWCPRRIGSFSPGYLASLRSLDGDVARA